VNVGIGHLGRLIDAPRIGEDHLAVAPGAVGAPEEIDQAEKVGILKVRDAAPEQAVADRGQREMAGNGCCPRFNCGCERV
jgi:hypothetical protein